MQLQGSDLIVNDLGNTGLDGVQIRTGNKSTFLASLSGQTIDNGKKVRSTLLFNDLSGNVYTRLEATLFDNLNGGNTISVNKALLSSVFTLKAFNDGQEVLNLTYNTGDLDEGDENPGLWYIPVAILLYGIDLKYTLEENGDGETTETTEVSFDLSQAYSGETFDHIPFTADALHIGTKKQHLSPSSGIPKPYALEVRTTNLMSLRVVDENYA